MDEILCEDCGEPMELIEYFKDEEYHEYRYCENCDIAVYPQTPEEVTLFNQAQEAAGQMRLPI